MLFLENNKVINVFIIIYYVFLIVYLYIEFIKDFKIKVFND